MTCVRSIIVSVLLWLKILQPFDRGNYLLVKSIQELRSKKDGLVTVGIGGPSGSGKTRYHSHICRVHPTVTYLLNIGAGVNFVILLLAGLFATFVFLILLYI